AKNLPVSSTTADSATMDKLYDGTSITEFYEWQTGFDNFNKQVVVTSNADSSTVTFQKPLSINYVHSNANDRSVSSGAIGSSPYNGMHFLLQYQGSGQLQGIPFEKLEGSDEGGQGQGRYYPVFALNDATVLHDGGKTYVVKALDMEQSMTEAPGACSSLSLSSVPTAPSAISTDYNIQIGAMPTLSDDTPPSVVGGEVQTQ
ncbi:MAG TPA: hypothetical protein VFM46_19865, partial [Pseudomonadales bacterium]|nr:hypothetical protein [Pseudomonadales bacterium]